MKNFIKALILVAMAYGTIVFMVNYFTSKKLTSKDGSGHSNFKAFLTPEEPVEDNDHHDSSVKAYLTGQDSEDSWNLEIKIIENEKPKMKEKAVKTVTKQEKKVQPKRKVMKVAIKYNPFALLGAYPNPDLYVEGPEYDQPHYGIINDDGYCNKVDLYNLEHPENMFKKMNFYTDFFKGALMKREVMSKMGTLFMQNVMRNMPKNVSESRSFRLDKEITTFHITTNQFYKYHQIGKHFLCATQMFSRIPNHTGLIQKDHFPQKIKQYALNYKDRPQCFNKTSFYPATYRLFDKKECMRFFKIINSDKYRKSLKTEPIQYLVKIGHGAHMAQGVFLLDYNQTKTLNYDFFHGKKCGKVDNYLIVQKYITNPMLLDNNNKFHMRVYVLIASTNPLIAYYHDGYLRASIFPFNKNSDERATHLTNLLMGDDVAAALNQSNNSITDGKTAKELEDYYLWSFEELANYLLESGKTNDPDWLDNHLRPTLQKAFVHIIRMNSNSFWKQSNVYELFGCDFVMDENMNLWFLEANGNPLLDGVQPVMITQMLKDLFEIEYAYYRSRMKRVITVIKIMLKVNGNQPIKGLKEWKILYQEAIRNKLDPEYPIKESNTFKVIIDESLPGTQAYFGVIREECLKK